MIKDNTNKAVMSREKLISEIHDSIRGTMPGHLIINTMGRIKKRIRSLEVLVLPICVVGKTVWLIGDWCKMYTNEDICSRKVLSMQIYENGDIQYHFKDGCFWEHQIGKSVFLSQGEAQNKLKEKGEEENE